MSSNIYNFVVKSFKRHLKCILYYCHIVIIPYIATQNILSVTITKNSLINFLSSPHTPNSPQSPKTPIVFPTSKRSSTLSSLGVRSLVFLYLTYFINTVSLIPPILWQMTIFF